MKGLARRAFDITLFEFLATAVLHRPEVRKVAFLRDFNFTLYFRFRHLMLTQT